MFLAVPRYVTEMEIGYNDTGISYTVKVFDLELDNSIGVAVFSGDKGEAYSLPTNTKYDGYEYKFEFDETIGTVEVFVSVTDNQIYVSLDVK